MMTWVHISCLKDITIQQSCVFGLKIEAIIEISWSARRLEYRRWMPKKWRQVNVLVFPFLSCIQKRSCQNNNDNDERI